MSKIEMQLAIHRTDQSKFFPVSVLLQYARVSYASHCAILGCFAQIRTASVVQAAGRACAPKIQAFARQSASWSSVRVKPCGMALNPASRVLRSDSVAWIGSPRGVSFVLPWCSANPPILDECRQLFPNPIREE